MSIQIAVDLGGTHLRAAAFRDYDKESIKHKKTTSRVEGETVFERILYLIKDVMPEDEGVSGIGIAVPGPVDPLTGIVLDAPNIPEINGFPLAERLAEKLNTPVYVGNDANLAALGEWRYGAGQGHNDLVYLTISTGVGGGVISGGRLFEGGAGLGAELGHVMVKADDEGPACSCGIHGHLEAFSSGTGIAKYVEWRLTDPETESSLRSSPTRTAVEIARAAHEKDPLALAAFNRAGRYLGIGVASFLHIFNPSILIFGGGVSQSGILLFDPMKRSLQEVVFSSAYMEQLSIVTAALGDDAGLLGALALVEKKEKEIA